MIRECGKKKKKKKDVPMWMHSTLTLVEMSHRGLKDGGGVIRS